MKINNFLKLLAFSMLLVRCSVMYCAAQAELVVQAAQAVPAIIAQVHCADGIDLPLDLNEDEGLTGNSFSELIDAKRQAGEDYLLALVTTQEGDSIFKHFYDANALNVWLFKVPGHPGEYRLIKGFDYRVIVNKPAFRNPRNNLMISAPIEYFVFLSVDAGFRHFCFSDQLGNDSIFSQFYANQDFNRAHKLGAYYEVAYMCSAPDSVDRNGNKAVACYNFVISQEDTSPNLKRRAQNNLGVLYLHGRGEIVKDYARALEYFSSLADQDEDYLLKRIAQFVLGFIYRKGGYGVVRDYARAVAYFNLVANQNEDLSDKRKAQFYLGDIYMEGGDGVVQDYDQAEAYLRPVAEQNDDIEWRDAARDKLEEIGEERDKEAAVAAQLRALPESVLVHCFDGSELVLDLDEIEFLTQKTFGALLNNKLQAGDLDILALVTTQEGKHFYDAHALHARFAQISALFAPALGQAGYRLVAGGDYTVIVNNSKYRDPKNNLMISAPIEYFGCDNLARSFRHFRFSDQLGSLGVVNRFYAHQDFNQALRIEGAYWIGEACYKHPKHEDVNAWREALSYLKEVAEQSENLVLKRNAQYILGRIYQQGGRGVARDLDKAVNYLQLVADQVADLDLSYKARRALREIREKQALGEEEKKE